MENIDKIAEQKQKFMTQGKPHQGGESWKNMPFAAAVDIIIAWDYMTVS